MSLCVEYWCVRDGKIEFRVGQADVAQVNPVMRARRTSGAVKTTPLSGLVGYALRRAQQVITADFSQTLAGLDLRPGQYAVLILIDQNPGTSQSNVCEALGIQKANFVATIADLVNRGLVRRRKSEADGRTYSLGLTTRGRSILEDAAKLQSLHEERVIAQIGTEGRLQLLNLLEQVASLPYGMKTSH
ncbi:MAG TPA: MarR family winged helix-turn-helix transcriptional regulator [Steroidobacteraceae bacterium]